MGKRKRGKKIGGRVLRGRGVLQRWEIMIRGKSSMKVALRGEGGG